MSARYSVGTWDEYLQAYTPQRGAGRCINVSLRGLRRVLKRLRELGYSAHRKAAGLGDKSRACNDWCVLVERTDGKTKAEILEGWKR